MSKVLINRNDFIYGFKKGTPILLGYIPVAFTFGLMAVNGGLPPLMAVFISLSNLTSAGQFAGTNLIIEGAGYLEIALTTFVINIRYMLMSLSLSQKIDPKITLWQRLIFGFGITDETFSMASMEKGKLSYSYMLGLITGPIFGWSFGTALGAFTCSALPQSLSNAMGIALFAMFIAIIVPPSKKSRPILMIVLISVTINLALKHIPIFSFISSGFRVIISTILGAGIGAALWPAKEENGIVKED
ncbi:AzlC family ABC transporter permease [Acetivibrio mesophilus]|mgnify:FL=1|uniref:Branched-chain amino acid ABC transporter permease n=1 Tax=Acetivibrio mesophilus TaxID=2487273 RepID=A0A4Q0I9S1_9FIRM|nr:AzlC family ABC transporter permease [Acetivibrio mesophilus]ODM26203.1 branched-chain amino acid ABC transporter permease [Clostridium sp. Bc-iso-3]RXE60745.1 branched-chain amino acid ABC transporter permease [Acetivibrio mesophilus]HHV28160.1 AzlC family ABC transporter permease [Clostridium sp.]